MRFGEASRIDQQPYDLRVNNLCNSHAVISEGSVGFRGRLFGVSMGVSKFGEDVKWGVEKCRFVVPHPFGERLWISYLDA